MNKRIILPLILILLLAFPIFASDDVVTISEEISANETAEPNIVTIGLYILNLGKFDISTGSFTADMYLSMTCSQSCSEQDFEFMNGRATSTEVIIDEPNERFYRIQANLNSQIDLRQYPFDAQKLEIILEDKERPVNDLVYAVNAEESGLDDSLFFAGWTIDDWEAVMQTHEYRVYDETYSQYRFTIPISRILFNSIIKTFLPIIFIILVMLSSFALDPDKITTRLAMVGSALVASVMFHVSLANQIPPVSYLTFTDKFMILTYFVMLMSFVFNVTLLELHERKNDALVMKIHRMTEFSMFLVVPVLYALLFIIFL